MIQVPTSVEKQRAQALEDLMRTLSLRALAATNPLFLCTSSGFRKCVASCVLLRIGSQIAVLTASHALDRGPGESFRFGAHDALLPLIGRVRRTTSQTGNPSETDLLDLAVVLLAPTIAAQVDPRLPITLPEVDTLSEPVERPLYLAVGYPYTSQGKHRHTQENAATAHRLLTGRRPLFDYAELGADPLRNLILRFDKREVFRAGSQVVARNPIGMSGGSVWLMPQPGKTLPRFPRLAGIMTKWHKSPPRRIIATRTVAAIELLFELDASLAPMISPLTFGRAT